MRIMMVFSSLLEKGNKKRVGTNIQTILLMSFWLWMTLLLKMVHYRLHQGILEHFRITIEYKMMDLLT